MKFCGRLDKNPQLSIRNIHDKKASEKLIIVYALPLSCTIKKNAIFTFRRLSRDSAADFPCGISKKLRMRSKTFTQCASISAPFWKILQISPHLLTQFSHASLALPTATFLFYCGKTRKVREPAARNQTAARRLQTASRRTQCAKFSAQN